MSSKHSIFIEAQWYAVYKLKFSLAIQDPDTTGIRYHTTLFVETSSTDGSGFIHHVTGDITSEQGMYYEKKSKGPPEQSQTFHEKQFMGYTTSTTYPQGWDNVLSRVPAPPKQKAFNIATMKTEPFKTLNPLTFYEPGESRAPLIKCTEWTEQRAIPALQSLGLIQEATAASPPGKTASKAT